MDEMFNLEEELKNALDEIKKNEKDLGLIVMIASTLFEKTEDMNHKLSII